MDSQTHWDTFSGVNAAWGRGQSAQGVSEGETAGMLVRPRGGSK